MQVGPGPHCEQRMESQQGNVAAMKYLTKMTFLETPSVLITHYCVSSTQKSCLPRAQAPGGLELPLGVVGNTLCQVCYFPSGQEWLQRMQTSGRGVGLHGSWYCFQQMNVSTYIFSAISKIFYNHTVGCEMNFLQRVLLKMCPYLVIVLYCDIIFCT